MLASDSHLDLETIAKKGLNFFKSCKFKLQEWIANYSAKYILLHVCLCDRAPCMNKIDLGTQPCQIQKL